MKNSRDMLTIILVLEIFFIFATVSFWPGAGVSSALAENRYRVGLASSKAGTTAYASCLGLSACVNKYAKGVYMEVVPTPGSVASAKLFGKNELDTAYLTNWGLALAYRNMGPFAKAPLKRKPYQGFYAFITDFLVIAKADRDDINSYHDLAGKKVFSCPAACDKYDAWRYIFTQFGIWDKIKDRQVGIMEAADALQMGTLDAIGGLSCDRGEIGLSWMRNIDARVNIKVVLPTPEKREQMRKFDLPGLFVDGKLSYKWISAKNRKYNPGEGWAWGTFQGWHPGSDMPTDVWYEIVKAWVENAKSDLADVNAFLKWLAQDPLSLQLEAIEASREVPVHPGMAKYLKERGLGEIRGLWVNSILVWSNAVHFSKGVLHPFGKPTIGCSSLHYIVIQTKYPKRYSKM